MLEFGTLVKFSGLDGHEKMKSTQHSLFGIFNVAFASHETHFVNISRVFANTDLSGLKN